MLFYVLGPMITLFFVGGTLLYRRAFLEMVLAFLTEGVPKAWEEATANRYFSAFQTGFWIAIALPIGGGLIAITTSRIVDAGVVQLMLYIAVVPSLAIFTVLLLLGDVLTSIVTFLLPAGEKTKQDIQDFYGGFTNYVWLGLAWESFITLLLVVAGVYATLWLLALCGFAMVVYFIVAKAYNKPVNWAPGVMMSTSAAIFILAVTIFIGALLPFTRPTLVWAGIPIEKFVHRGVVDGRQFDAAETTYNAKLRGLCNEGLQKLQEEIGRLALKGNDVPVADLREKRAKLTKLKQECI